MRDLRRMKEVYFHRELLSKNPSFLQVGATSTDLALCFLENHPAGRAAICEPDPETFWRLKSADRLQLVNCGMSGNDGVVSFWRVKDKPCANSLTKPSQHPEATRTMVHVSRPAAILDMLGWAPDKTRGIGAVDLLALDCEGAERQIIPFLFPQGFRQVWLEWHVSWGYYNNETRGELAGKMISAGYEMYVDPGNLNYALFY